MRKVIVSSYMTLDGKVEDLRDWVLPYDDEMVARYHTGLLAGSDGLLMGRATYEIFAAMWPPRSGLLPYAGKINGMAKYVASTTLTSVDWENSHLIKGDVAEAVAELKQQPGRDLVVYGGLALIRYLTEHDLVDEYRFLVHPVLLGKGRGFVAQGAARVDLELVESVATSSGVAVLTYRPVR